MPLDAQDQVKAIIASFAGDKTDVRMALQVLWLCVGQVLVQCDPIDAAVLWAQFRKHMDQDLVNIIARIRERQNATDKDIPGSC